MIYCKLCNQEFITNSSGQLTLHIKKIHNFSLEDYIIQTELNGIEPKCKCGICNQRPLFYRGKFLDYVSFHNKFDVREKLYIEKFGYPVCKICGKKTKFHRGNAREFCSIECAMSKKGWNNPAVQAKVKATVQERYNVDNVFQLENIKQIIADKTKNRVYLPLTEEHKKNIGLGSKLVWKRPGYHAKISKAISNAIMNNPEELLRRSNHAKLFPVTYSNRFSKCHQRIRAALNLEGLGFISEVSVDRYVVDELNEQKKVAVEINGDYIHANPIKYDANFIVKIGSSSYTAVEKWTKDAHKIERLKSLGYRVLVIWESDDLTVIKNKLNSLLNDDA